MLIKYSGNIFWNSMIWVHSLVFEFGLVTSYVNNNKEEGAAMTDL